MATDLKEIKIRLEVLRREIRKEGISYGELLELQSYAEHIDKNDVELLEWAGVGEGLNYFKKLTPVWINTRKL